MKLFIGFFAMWITVLYVGVYLDDYYSTRTPICACVIDSTRKDSYYIYRLNAEHKQQIHGREEKHHAIDSSSYDSYCHINTLYDPKMSNDDEEKCDSICKHYHWHKAELHSIHRHVKPRHYDTFSESLIILFFVIPIIYFIILAKKNKR